MHGFIFFVSQSNITNVWLRFFTFTQLNYLCLFLNCFFFLAFWIHLFHRRFIFHISFQFQRLKTRSLGFVIIFDIHFFQCLKCKNNNVDLQLFFNDKQWANNIISIFFRIAIPHSWKAGKLYYDLKNRVRINSLQNVICNSFW